jgi:hypothetical protein
MSARKRLPSALTDRFPMLAGRVDKILLVGGQRSVAVPALVMSAESKAFVDRAFARVPKSKRITFTSHGAKHVGVEPEAFLFAMFKLWASDGLEKPLQAVGQAMVDEFLLVCRTGAPVQMEAIFQGLGFERP